MNAADIIDGAINIVSTNWHQGGLVGPDGQSFCIIGALSKSAGGQVVLLDENIYDVDIYPDSENYKAYKSARITISQTIRQENGSTTGSIALFNDDENTTLEDALLILKKARASLEES